MLPLHPDLCPYTLNSLKYFLLATIYDNLPFYLSIIVYLILPEIILNYIIRNGRNHIKLVKHQPVPNHPHSSWISLGVILRSSILGIILSIGLKFAFQGPDVLIPLGVYMALLAFFHFSEYFVTSITNPATLNNGSFLLYQSPAYVMAISASFVEYTIEAYLFPESKRFNFLAFIGLITCIIGEFIRKLAMFTAGENFSHLIQSTKRPNHNLITHGIYSHFRHPSYAGWFYWAIGSQIVMQNPFCTLLFAVISYEFFRKRIAYEEQTLVDFFGQEYVEYKQKVGLWMPIWHLNPEAESQEIWPPKEELKAERTKE